MKNNGKKIALSILWFVFISAITYTIFDLCSVTTYAAYKRENTLTDATTLEKGDILYLDKTYDFGDNFIMNIGEAYAFLDGKEKIEFLGYSTYKVNPEKYRIANFRKGEEKFVFLAKREDAENSKIRLRGFKVLDINYDEYFGENCYTVEMYFVNNLPEKVKIENAHKTSIEQFKDIPKNEWYYEYVKLAIYKGLMNGTSEDEFSPDSAITRGMFLTLMYRIANVDYTYNDSHFTDIDSEMYYSIPIAWAYSKGITDGLSETTFGPEEKITREQAVLMLYRYLAEEEPEGGNKSKLFADSSKISSYAEEAIEWAVQKGILNGKDDNMLCPDEYMTRGESAAFFIRTLEIFENINLNRG